MRREEKALRRDDAALTPVSWEPREGLSFEDWVGHGRRLGATARAVGWWIGDWVRFGNVRYGERYSRAARITGYDAQTLMNMAWVASRFEISRRREKLSWSHHAELVALDDDDQEAWLDAAEANRMSVRSLREELRRARKAARDAPPGSERVAGPGALVCPECGHTFATAHDGAPTPLPEDLAPAAAVGA
jgi:hypothetical protein